MLCCREQHYACFKQHLRRLTLPAHILCSKRSSKGASVCHRSKAKLVWVLSFVLAPYTHILSQATHKTDAHRFIEGVMPRLLEQSHAQQAASLQTEASGILLDLSA